MQGLSLCKSYFFAVGLPMLKGRFGPVAGRIAAGLVGDGSECYGFDDEISRDHDWGPGFCLWLSRPDYEDFGAGLSAAYEALPKTFAGFGPRVTSNWGEGRVGVFCIEDFYSGFIGLPRAPETLDEWLAIPENCLAAATNGEVFLDPLGGFSEIREKLLKFYPEDVRRKKIAARLMTAAPALVPAMTAPSRYNWRIRRSSAVPLRTAVMRD